MTPDPQPLPPPAFGSPPAFPAALARAVTELNHFLDGRRPDLRFACDVHEGRPQVLIVDALSGNPLRRMDAAEALRTARLLEHERLGLVRQQA